MELRGASRLQWSDVTGNPAHLNHALHNTKRARPGMRDHTSISIAMVVNARGSPSFLFLRPQDSTPPWQLCSIGSDKQTWRVETQNRYLEPKPTSRTSGLEAPATHNLTQPLLCLLVPAAVAHEHAPHKKDPKPSMVPSLPVLHFTFGQRRRMLLTRLPCADPTALHRQATRRALQALQSLGTLSKIMLFPRCATGSMFSPGRGATGRNPSSSPVICKQSSDRLKRAP